MRGDIVSFKLEKATNLFDSLPLLETGALVSQEEFDNFYIAAAKARNDEELDQTNQIMLSIQASKSPRHILCSGHLGCA